MRFCSWPLLRGVGVLSGGVRWSLALLLPPFLRPLRPLFLSFARFRLVPVSRCSGLAPGVRLLPRLPRWFAPWLRPCLPVRWSSPVVLLALTRWLSLRPVRVVCRSRSSLPPGPRSVGALVLLARRRCCARFLAPSSFPAAVLAVRRLLWLSPKKWAFQCSSFPAPARLLLACRPPRFGADRPAKKTRWPSWSAAFLCPQFVRASPRFRPSPPHPWRACLACATQEVHASSCTQENNVAWMQE